MSRPRRTAHHVPAVDVPPQVRLVAAEPHGKAGAAAGAQARPALAAAHRRQRGRARGLRHHRSGRPRRRRVRRKGPKGARGAQVTPAASVLLAKKHRPLGNATPRGGLCLARRTRPRPDVRVSSQERHRGAQRSRFLSRSLLQRDAQELPRRRRRAGRCTPRETPGRGSRRPLFGIPTRARPLLSSLPYARCLGPSH